MPLSTGTEMIGELQRVFGGVHYQEPRSPYLFCYAEMGFRFNIDQGSHTPGPVYLGLLRCVIS